MKDSLAAQGLLPSSPLTKALAYAHKRRAALEVFLTDPDVPIDTNHLERALRPIPMGRKTGCSAGRSWRPACWRRPEFDRDPSAAPGRSIRLSSSTFSQRRPTPGRRRRTPAYARQWRSTGKAPLRSDILAQWRSKNAAG